MRGGRRLAITLNDEVEAGSVRAAAGEGAR